MTGRDGTGPAGTGPAAGMGRAWRSMGPVGGRLAGTGILTRLALRRDRIMMVCWIYVLTAFAYVSVVSTKKLYPTAASRLAFAAGPARTGSPARSTGQRVTCIPSAGWPPGS